MFKLYTQVSDQTASSSQNAHQPLSSEQFTTYSRQMFEPYFQSKETILRWYLSSGNSRKIQALGFLLERIYRQGYRTVVSFGAGPSVLEYLLTCALPSSVRIVAADYDAFCMERAASFFNPLIARPFDLFQDDPNTLQTDLGHPIDLAVFFGSSYVMNDTQFVHFFQRLREIGVKEIIDFQPACVAIHGIFRAWINSFQHRYLSRVRPSLSQTQFHGYARTRNEWRRLYAAAGWHNVQETSMGPYPYVAVCE